MFTMNKIISVSEADARLDSPKMYEYSDWNPYASVDMAKETVQVSN